MTRPLIPILYGFYILLEDPLKSLKKLDAMQQTIPAIRTLNDNTLFMFSNRIRGTAEIRVKIGHSLTFISICDL